MGKASWTAMATHRSGATRRFSLIPAPQVRLASFARQKTCATGFAARKSIDDGSDVGPPYTCALDVTATSTMISY
ncbi:hypothetical protein [Xanthomonas tesorieronis]|uniref:hypothetical protein n=1 Tax=Xanthomonas tesorieronis TaxID=3160839 RepID=UPI0035144D5C